MVDIGRSPNMRQIDNLDHRNTYIIKKMLNNLINEFKNALEDKNMPIMNETHDLVCALYKKIENENFLWAKRTNRALTEMARKLNK